MVGFQGDSVSKSISLLSNSDAMALESTSFQLDVGIMQVTSLAWLFSCSVGTSEEPWDHPNHGLHLLLSSGNPEKVPCRESKGRNLEGTVHRAPHSAIVWHPYMAQRQLERPVLAFNMSE